MIKSLEKAFEELGLESGFKKEQTLVELGFDSLRIMELVVVLEENFSILIPDNELISSNFYSVETLLEMLERVQDYTNA
jgi:acyl carrier protein